MSKQTNEIEVKVTGEGQAKSKLGSLASFISSKFVITLGDIVAIGKKVIDFFVSASAEATKQEDAILKLNQALKNQGIYTAQVSKKLQDYASKMQETTKFGDDAVNNLQAMLISYGLLPDEVNAVTMSVADLATGLGMDLESAGQLVSKTMGSTTNAFARYGIEVDGNVNSTERLTSLMDGISTKFGGQALASANKYSGSVEKLKNNWGELLEVAGGMTNKLFQPFVDGTNAVISAFNKMANATSNYYEGQRLLGDLFKKGTTVIKDYNLAQIENLKSAVLNFKMDKKFTDEYITAINARVEAIKKEDKAIADKAEKERKQKEEDAKRLQDRIDGKRNEIEELRATNQLTIDEEIAKNEELLVIAKGNAEEQDKVRAKLRDLKLAKLKEEADKEKTINEAISASYKKMIDDKVKADIELSDALAGGFETTLNYYKKMLTAQIDAWMATEIAKNFYNPFMIASIVGAGAVGKAGINSVQFAQGGQFETSPNVMQTNAGQTAVTNEKGLEIHKVEAIGKTQSSGSSTVPIIIQLGGVELKKIAVNLKPYLNAIDRGVI